MDVTYSKISLANYAAVKIGAKSFNFGDGSSSDKVFNVVYDPVREQCLEECPWTFATTTVALTELSIPSTTPVLNFNDGIMFAYSFPSDYLKAIYFNFPQAYIIQENIPGVGPAILSNMSGLSMKYLFNNDNPATYSPKFYEAMACKLAEQACFKLVEAAQYQGKMGSDYERAFLTAAASDGQTISPEVVNQGFWEWARLAGSNAAVGDPPNSLNIGWWPQGGGWA
jgi:hypothetical protein